MGPPEKQKVLNSMRLALLKAYKGVLAQNEEKYSVSGLHKHFAHKKETAQPNVLVPAERLREMMERKNYYGTDTLFPIVAALVDKSLGLVENRDLTLINVFYTEMIQKVLFDPRGDAWVKNELERLRSEI